MPLPTDIQLSYLDALIKDALKRQSDILLARAYHEGKQPVYLTDRQKEYLDLHQDNQYCLNATRTVVTALRDELTVIGFDTGEKAGEDGIKKQAQFFWDLWNSNNMDAMQGEVHEWALRDSESFIILDWDKDDGRVTMFLHERFTSIDSNCYDGRWDDVSDATIEAMTGTNQGVWALYENDDPNQKMILAVQQWNEITQDEKMDSRLKRTIYYPDRIERFEMSDKGDWVQAKESQPWLDRQNKPLGIPVIHFKNENMRPEAWDAIPLQDGVNKSLVDIHGTMDLSGFPIFILLGIYPTNDGLPPAADNSNVWNMGPAQFLGNANKGSDAASVQKFDGSDPTPLMETLKDQIVFIAQITSTPTSRFVITAQVASDSTLKEQEQALKKKAKTRQTLFGDAWERVMYMARRINNKFGTDEFSEELKISTIWKNIENTEDILKKKELGIPEETLWEELGYSQQQIIAIKATAEYRLKFLTAFWTAFNSASSSGQGIKEFALSIGLSDDEIKLVTAGTDTTIPPDDI